MKILKIYYNPKFADKYIIYYDYIENKDKNLYMCLTMNDKPFHPQGIGMHVSGQLGKHNGKIIKFKDLPIDCQKAVKQDLEE